MARIGHSSFKAALTYQHAADERNAAIADFMDEQIAATRQEPIAPVILLGNTAS